MNVLSIDGPEFQVFIGLALVITHDTGEFSAYCVTLHPVKVKSSKLHSIVAW